MKIKLKGKEVKNNSSVLEEKQYTDMWSNDEYLQFMYERLVLIKELLSDRGVIYLHTDWHKVHHLRCIMDEIYGEKNFRNEIIWYYSTLGRPKDKFAPKHDNILVYGKTLNSYFDEKNAKVPYSKEYIASHFTDEDEDGKQCRKRYDAGKWRVYYPDEGMIPNDVWEIPYENSMSLTRTNYPTQKPEAILERIINSSTKIGALVFDCFMGSGTTMAVAQKLGRKFIGADINLGAIQTTTKRLLKIVDDNKDADLSEDEEYKACGFEVYNVNNYDVFKNPAQAKDLLIEALEIDPLGQGNYFDGMKDGHKVKIMPINRIATKKDVSDLINNLNYKEYEQLAKDNSKAKVDDILLVCMGHDSEMTPHFKKECQYNINIDIFDILKDGSELVFKRESEAKVVVDGSTLTVEKFYPNTLLEKLRQDGTEVEDYREMVESIMIDTNYDGSVFEPTIVDIPEKKELVSGEYELPEDSGTIAIKITDLLSETYFEVVSNG